MGAFFPFLSLFFHQRGFNSGQIGILLAVGSLTAIIAQPVFGVISDTAKDYRTPLKVVLILSILGIYGFFFSHTFAIMLLTVILFNFINSPVGPLVDSIAVEKGPENGFEYGKVRLWGALGFALITVIAGYVLSAVGYQYAFPTYSVIALVVLIIVFAFPMLEKPKHGQGSVFGKDVLGAVFLNKKLIGFIGITLLVTSCMTMNVSFLPIYFEKMGYPINMVGWNFTIAAIVETPLFWLSTKLIRRVGLFSLLSVGIIAYVVKYAIMGLGPSVGVVLAVQALDGVAFAFYFSTAVEIVNVMAPVQAKATAQTVFGAATGVSGIIGNLVGGFIMDVHGPQFLFWIMAVISGVAVALFLTFPSRRSYQIQH